jgi:hypothetical protein
MPLTPAQQALKAQIEAQVAGSLGTLIGGTFHMVVVPGGFNYGIQYDMPPLTNATTLQTLDSLLDNSSGVMTLADARFSTLYFNILSAASYQYSTGDQAVVNDPGIQNQEQAVVAEGTSGGYTAQYPDAAPATGATYYSIVKSVLTNFGLTGAQTFTAANISAAAGHLGDAGFAGLEQAISSALQKLAPLNAILNVQTQRQNELNAALNNTQNPSATNGGVQTQPAASLAYYVNYQNLPTNNQLQGGLNSGSKVEVQISASNFSSKSTQMSINGSAGFDVSIFDFLNIGFGGSASYNMSKYTSSATSLNMTMTWYGVTPVPANPMPLSTDYSTGWYDLTLLQSIVNYSGNPAVSGFKIPTGSQYNISDTFGQGKLFSRLRTFVVSQYPTIKMVFSAADANAISTDFQEKSSTDVSFLGLFSMGSVSQSYQVQSCEEDQTAGTVTVVLAPPAPTGTVPLNQQVCQVLGGVAEYPPQTTPSLVAQTALQKAALRAKLQSR